MEEFYYNSVNFCQAYYLPKLENIHCSTCLCLLRCEPYEENLSFTRLNHFANDSQKNLETYKVPSWLFICLHILLVSSG